MKPAVVDKKPTVVDWEKNNFGIRTSHSSQDFLNNVNIDTNAPQITRKKNPFRHESRKKDQKPPIIRNYLRIRNRPNNPESEDEEKDIVHHTSFTKSSKNKTSSSSKKLDRNISTQNKNKGDRLSARGRLRKGQKLSLTTESIPKAETDSLIMKPVKDSFEENLLSPGKSLRRKYLSRNKTLNIPNTSVKTTTKNGRTDFWHRTTKSTSSLLRSTTTKKIAELQTEADKDVIKDDSMETTTDAIEERTTEMLFIIQLLM